MKKRIKKINKRNKRKNNKNKQKQKQKKILSEKTRSGSLPSGRIGGFLVRTRKFPFQVDVLVFVAKGNALELCDLGPLESRYYGSRTLYSYSE